MLSHRKQGNGGGGRGTTDPAGAPHRKMRRLLRRFRHAKFGRDRPKRATAPGTGFCSKTCGAGGGGGGQVQSAGRGKYDVGACDDGAGARGGIDEGAGDAGKLTAQGVANTLWAYARGRRVRSRRRRWQTLCGRMLTVGRVPEEGLMGKLEGWAGTFKVQDVANTMWARATMARAPGPDLIRGLEKRAEAVAGTLKAGRGKHAMGVCEGQAGTFKAQEVANTLWAYATMGRVPEEGLMGKLEGRAEALAGTFKAQDVANTMWARATMAREPGAVMIRELKGRAELEGRAEALAGTFNEQNVARTLWAYATMGREPGAGLMRELEGRAEALVGTFKAQGVANTLWAYATMGREPEAGLMRGLEGRAEAVAGTFKAQDVANTLWQRECLLFFAPRTQNCGGSIRCCSAWCPWTLRFSVLPNCASCIGAAGRGAERRGRQRAGTAGAENGAARVGEESRAGARARARESPGCTRPPRRRFSLVQKFLLRRKPAPCRQGPTWRTREDGLLQNPRTSRVGKLLPSDR